MTLRPPERLDGVIGDLREDDDKKIRGNVALFVAGLAFFIQTVIITVRFFSQGTRLQSPDSLAGSLFGCLGCWLWALYLSTTDHNRRRWLKRALITLVAVFACVEGTLSAIRLFHDRQVEIQARQWFTHAQTDAKPTWTDDNAIHWLCDHGIQAYRGERSGSNGHYYLVEGYRQLQEGGGILGPASLCISFLFGLDHKFDHVEYKVRPYEPPGARR